MKTFFLLANFCYFLFSSSFAFAEGSGITLTYLGTTINVRYNNNVDDKISGVDYIREPSGALFDLIYLVQNSNILDKAKFIDVDIDNHGGSLWIYKSKPDKQVLLEKSNLKTLNNRDISLTLCKELGVKKCTPTSNSTIDLYLSNHYLSRNNSDLIEFGCFPCRNDKTIALTDIYKSPDEQNKPLFKKVTVTRQTIYHYFNKLRE